MGNKKRIKDYHKQKKEIKNPFIKKKRSRIKWGKILLTLLIMALAGGVGWWLFFSGYWDIEKIEVHGVSRISKEAIREQAREQTKEKKLVFLDQKNLMLFDKQELIGELRDKYHFPEIDIDKKITDKLIITIKENQCAYILKENEKYYKIDKENYVLDTQNEIEDEDTPIIINSEGQAKVTGDRSYIKSNYVDYIIELYGYLEENSEDMEIENFILDNQIPDMEGVEKNTIKMQLKNAPMVYLSMESTPEQQIEKLLLLKEKELQQEFQNKEYIILKYGDRIFYK